MSAIHLHDAIFSAAEKGCLALLPSSGLNEEGSAAEKQERSDLTPALSEESAMAVNCWDSCFGTESDLAG